METAALIATSLLGFVMVFQIALAFGAPWGRSAWGGQHPEVLSRRLRVASGIAGIVLYPLFMDGVLSAAGLIDRAALWTPSRVGVWVLTVLFTIGGVMDLASRSRSERVWGPVSLVIAGCCAVVAVGMRG